MSVRAPRLSDTLINVRNLAVEFRSGSTQNRAVKGVSFTIGRGETVALVGESGSGKTVSALSIMRLLPYPAAHHPSGEIFFEGRDLLKASEATMREIRGDRISIIFQEPMTSLNPLHTIEKQVGEILKLHRGLPEAETKVRVLDLLAKVGIRDAEKRLAAFPHQLSGGQRQRVMIAMALANEPDLLIADEPTTALDVTVQAQILDLLVDLQQEFNSAIVLITHDLGVVSRVADDVLVMYAGRGVEHGSVEQVLRRPQHPYTWGLLASVPSLHAAAGTSLLPIPGNPPSLIDLPTGCAFHPRCRYAGHTGDRSFGESPALRSTGEPGHLLACHLPNEDRRRLYERDIATAGVTL